MRCCCKSNGWNSGAMIAVYAAVSVSTFGWMGASAKKAKAEGDAGAPAVAPDKGGGAATAKESDALAFTMNRLDGAPQDLGEYRGKVVLIVNTASKCGLTPQYTKLESLYRDKKDAGFVILGFPANDFLSQEPGTDKEIAEFCTANYGVTFPMFSKISVKGEQQHPLYARLTSMPAPIGGDIRWNFDKFLLDRGGKVVARFGPKTAPDDAEMVARIDELLKAGAQGGSAAGEGR